MRVLIAGAIGAAMLVASAPAVVAGESSSLRSGFFVEGAFGANFGKLGDFTFSNPIGAATTNSGVNGDQIMLDNTDESDSALGAKAALGYRHSSNALVRVSYAYTDQMEFDGFATFGANPFQQRIEVDAHVVMLELGYDYPINKHMFIEGTVGAGVAFVTTDGRQGLNVAGNYNRFPGQTRENLAANVSLGLGFNLTENVGLLLTGDYSYLGRASTGRTSGIEVANSTGVNLSEELAADVGVFRYMMGLRYTF